MRGTDEGKVVWPTNEKNFERSLNSGVRNEIDEGDTPRDKGVYQTSGVREWKFRKEFRKEECLLVELGKNWQCRTRKGEWSSNCVVTSKKTLEGWEFGRTQYNGSESSFLIFQKEFRGWICRVYSVNRSRRNVHF